MDTSTFAANALPLAALNLRIIPVEPYDKACKLLDWQNLATTDAAVIIGWDAIYPHHNLGIVAKLAVGELCVLEFDVRGGMTAAAEECGQPVPKTRTHRSGKGFGHYLFWHTAKSVALGNRQANQDGGEWFSFRADNRYVVAPPSIHPNGNAYKVYDDSPIIPIPDWLTDWIAAHTQDVQRPKGSVEVHDDFNFDAWCGHYGIAILGEKDGCWQIVAECPGTGARHEHSTLTAFFYDGSSFGWNCFAQGCPLNGKSIGDVIRWLHENGHEPYTGIIWHDKDDLSFLNDPKFGVEMFDADEMLTEATVSSDAKVVAATASVSAPQLATDAMDIAWAERAEKLNPTPLPMPDDIDAIINVEQAKGLAFDERALYGLAGEIARNTRLPLGWSYPGILAVASALDIRDKDGHVRSNIYCALIAPPGMAKTVVQDAIERSIFLPLGRVTYTTPASDRGLAKMIGKGGSTVMLMEDEFRAVLGKCQVPNSTLAQMICKLWNKNQAGVADKKGADVCIGKFCILGNLACDDPADFRKVFGNSTVTGMYDRFIFGYDSTPVKYRPQDIKPLVMVDEMVVRIPTWVWDAKDRWGDAVPNRNRRLTEHALRVAIVTAAINGDKEITAPCLAAALRFVEWQERLRPVFKPGLAETKEAECYEAVYAALRAQHDHQRKNGEFPKGADLIGHDKEALPNFLHFTNIMSAKNLYRKYGRLVTGVKSTMLQEGIVDQVTEIQINARGHKIEGRNTPFYVLRKLQ